MKGNRHSFSITSFKPVDIICENCGEMTRYSAPPTNYPKVYSRVEFECTTCQIPTQHIVLGDAEKLKEELRFMTEEQKARPWVKEVIDLLENQPQKSR